jgi:SAM-dependent methyltransferase
MQNQLRNGIPGEHDYKALIESDEFKEMERFSNSFLLANKKELESYSRQWAGDPLHQWSRQWEYPFAYKRIESVAKSKVTARIFDAGSGITFFPYYIKSRYPLTEIHCSDYDKSLDVIYQRINANNEHKAIFSNSDLRKLPYENEWFDIIYCVSVLEHTDDYAGIIESFDRILAPGGKLIVTFDVSLDGTRDISVEKGTRLLKSLAERFESAEDVSLDLGTHVMKPQIFTTHSAKEISEALLPWRLPSFVYRVKSLITGRQLGLWPPILTVFCLSLTKHESR